MGELNGLTKHTPTVLRGVAIVIISAAILAAFGTYTSQVKMASDQGHFIKEIQGFKTHISEEHNAFDRLHDRLDDRLRWVETGQGPP